jgi:hypothetical protein
MPDISETVLKTLSWGLETAVSEMFCGDEDMTDVNAARRWLKKVAQNYNVDLEE